MDAAELSSTPQISCAASREEGRGGNGTVTSFGDSSKTFGSNILGNESDVESNESDVESMVVCSRLL